MTEARLKFENLGLLHAFKHYSIVVSRKSVTNNHDNETNHPKLSNIKAQPFMTITHAVGGRLVASGGRWALWILARLA